MMRWGCGLTLNYSSSKQGDQAAVEGCGGELVWRMIGSEFNENQEAVGEDEPLVSHSA